MPTRSRYALSFLAVGSVFAIVNYLDFHRPEYGADFIYHHGLPFHFFVHGGFQGLHAILWRGVLADLALALCLAVILAQTLKRLL